MQNFFGQFPSSTASTPFVENNEHPNSDSITYSPPANSSSSTIPQPTIPVPSSTLPDYPILPYPSVLGPTGIPISLGQHELILSEEERKLQCKVARNRRRLLARQRSVPVSRQSQPFASLTLERRRDADDALASNRTRSELYTFSAPNGKNLRLLLTKELKSSDVTSLGRIVLPKKEVEEHLPILYHKEGIQIILTDIRSDREWQMRFKFWCNNRSRMYLLEGAGEFVKHEGLRMGDAIAIYEDQQKNLFITYKKREQPTIHTAVMNESSRPQNEIFINTQQPLVQNDSITSPTSEGRINQTEDDSLNDLDEFYDTLGELPELNSYDYFLFDKIINESNNMN